MTRTEAEAQCAARNREAERTGVGDRWLPREMGDGEWLPARIRVAGIAPRTPLTATVEAKPRPATADDPRQGVLRDVPPYGGV